MSDLKLTVRDLQDSWACKHAQQELSSDERVAEITALLDQERADAWDEAIELLQTNSEINLDDLEHYQSLNPYRKEQTDE